VRPDPDNVTMYLNDMSVAETATGRAQWEHPGTGAVPEPAAPTDSPSPTQQPAHTAKRRQYAAGQTQAYYGGSDTVAAPSYGAHGAQPPNPGGGQLFTPGLAAENQFAQQQHQQQQQAGPSYYAQQRGEPEYINAPGYGQPPVAGYGAGGVGQLTDQFGQMGMNGGQKPFQIYTTNLLTSPPDPRDLELPPPSIRLPAGSCLANSPLANAHYSYQRGTVNAIPSSNSIVSKSKIPLGLVITPYRTVKEGDEPVPVVTDTIIARCRRCRTYINPYVQFIDGGNRCVNSNVLRTLSRSPSLVGAAVCVACRTRSHNCLTGIRPGTSLGIAGRVLS
jgi:protein transport protein SEC24